MPLFGSKNKHNHDATTGHHTTGGVPPAHADGSAAYRSTADTNQPYVGSNQPNPYPQGGAPAFGAGNHDAHHPQGGATALSTGNHDTRHKGGSFGTKLTGRVESAVGSAIGSSALKAKGMEKEREANALNLQSSELAEAERLEREAKMRRERAVGHGAHPSNSAPTATGGW